MHFRGNFPRAVKVEACDVAGDDWEHAEWKEIVVERKMKADEEADCTLVEGTQGLVCTHARLTIIPDGGVKRFRIFGTKV
jgi:allantoicase